jgi:predicted acylesterase/phospholipase RssA
MASLCEAGYAPRWVAGISIGAVNAAIIAGNPPDRRVLRLREFWDSCDAAVTVVLLIHRRAAYWTQSNDYEFSRYSMEEHWLSGREDV